MSCEKYPELSIIIVNYKAEKYLKLCLESIIKKIKGIKYEIIIIDNGSENNYKVSENNYPQIKFIRNKKNVGFSYANNQGIKASKGKYLLLLNPDTEVLNNAFAKMSRYLDANPSVGIVGPCIYERDGKTIQLSCRTFPSFATAIFNRYSLISKLLPKNKWSNQYLLTNWDHKDRRDIDWVSGCCMMLRKEMLNKIGLLDTRFFMYNEDVDVCMRAKNKGWQVYYLPESKIKHYIGGSSHIVEKKMIVERHKSIWQFYKKHYSKNIFVDILTFMGIIIRACFKLTFSLKNR